jgi:hypothetical protein
MNPVHIFQPYIPKIHSNIIFPSHPIYGQSENDLENRYTPLEYTFLSCLFHSVKGVIQEASFRFWNKYMYIIEITICMGKGEVFPGFWLGGLKGRDHWEDLSIGGRITLRWTLGR